MVASAKLGDLLHSNSLQGYDYTPPQVPAGLYETPDVKPPPPPPTTTTTTTTTPPPPPPPPQNDYLPPPRDEVPQPNEPSINIIKVSSEFRYRKWDILGITYIN